jgi:hypothetical protein
VRCAFNGADASKSAFIVTCVVLVLTLTGIVAGIAGAGMSGPGNQRSRGGVASSAMVTPVLLAGAAGLVWLLVVPPFEGPDEAAHVQYASYIAATGSLPRELPAPDSPWHEYYYEWVQPPAAHLAAALLFRAGKALGFETLPDFEGGVHAPPLRLLEPNPRSMVAGSVERTVYRHPLNGGGGNPSPLLYTFRAMNVACTILIVALTFRLLNGQLNDGRLASVAASALVLVPQWSAVHSIAGNDAAATLLATLAFLLIARLAAGGTNRAAVITGAVIGTAVVTKLTTAFLVPTAAAALLMADRRSQRGKRAGLVIAGSLVPLVAVLGRNAVVFGDPFATTFKQRILEQSGFLALSQLQPGVSDPAFWHLLRAQVFEAFWARFGSLGAGPDPGSRVWWIYSLCSAGIFFCLVAGAASLRATRHQSRARRAHASVLVVAVAGVMFGLTGWIVVNLSGRPDVIVHWTPRHILPLTAPCLLVAAAGARWCRERIGGSMLAWRSCGVAVVIALGLAWITSLRHVIQQFRFGFL